MVSLHGILLASNLVENTHLKNGLFVFPFLTTATPPISTRPALLKRFARCCAASCDWDHASAMNASENKPFESYEQSKLPHAIPSGFMQLPQLTSHC
jgi:hypothetical protein